MIIDAGGGTVDISTYAIIKSSPITVEEISSPECMPMLCDRRLRSLIHKYRSPAGFH